MKINDFIQKIFSFLSNVKTKLSKVKNRVKQSVSLVLGSFSWTPPSWGMPFKNWISQKKAWVIENKKRSSKFLYIGAGILALSALFWIWNPKLPKLVKVDFSYSNPPVTLLGDEIRPIAFQVNFNASVAPLKMIGKKVTKGISLSPKLEGEWTWSNDRTLMFLPRLDWGVGQEYKVVFAKEGLFAEKIRLERYKLIFQSAPFEGQIDAMEFYQDPTDPKMKKVVATLSFTHPVDSRELEKKVFLFLAEKKPMVRALVEKKWDWQVTYDKYKAKAFIHSSPISIPDEDTYMKMVVEDGIHSSRGGSPTKEKFERRTVVPGMSTYFRINSSELSLAQNEKYETEQVLVVNMSNGVTAKSLHEKIQAFVLPIYHPDQKEEKQKNPYRWGDPAQIGPEILKLSTPLNLDPLETEKEFSSTISFRFQADVKRFIYLHIPRGLESFGGYLLSREFSEIHKVPEFPKEVKILGEGSLLGLSGDRKISILTRDLKAVQIEVSQVLSDQVHLFVNHGFDDFKKPSYGEGYSRIGLDSFSERFTEVRETAEATPGKPHYFAFDLSKYLDRDQGGRRGLFLIKIKSYDPETKRTIYPEDFRFFLVTDLGLLVKDSVDGSHDVFVQSLITGRPVSGASVRILGKNGLPILTSMTNPEGRAHFPTLESFIREKEPTVYTVSLGRDFSFIPYDRPDRRQELSKFDIGGVTNRLKNEDLTAFLFSNRGLYRPGDEIRAGLIVKGANWNQNVEGIPLEFSLEDARGVSVKKERIQLSPAGFEDLSYQTQETSPTGTYSLSVFIVKDNKRSSLIGSTTVQVQEFLPDEMRITSNFSETSRDGWVSPHDLKARVSLENLFGTPAVDHRISASMTLSPCFPSFRGFTDYHFFDPDKGKETFTDPLPDAETNGEGIAEFDLDLKRFPGATYFLRFNAEGFIDEGGRSVTSESTTVVSPRPFLVGYKEDGSLGYISRGGERSIHWVALNSKVQKIAASELTLQLMERKFVSVLTRQENGTYRYQSVEKKIRMLEKDFSIPASGFKYSLPTDRAGDFLLSVVDRSGSTLNEVNFTVVGAGNLSRSLEKNAELQLLLNKPDYNPGEEIEIQIKSPYTGSGLITIERDKVYESRWFTTTTTNSIQRIRVPNDFEGNGYVSVSFVRDINSREIFMSPLSYGVIPFLVSRQKRTLGITLQSQDLVKPGQPLKIKYRTDRPSRIILFAVDEGILQVANYKTPDPLSYFFQKRALEVKTSQILDLIMPEYKLLMNLSAAGGDEMLRRAIGQNLNPFRRKTEKPIVFWSGILNAGPEEKEAVYTIPDYFNGTLRVMAVATNQGSIGTFEKKAIVRGDFVIQPHVPTFVAPGDEFEVSASIANNVEGSGKGAPITVELSTSKHIEVIGKNTLSLKIDEMREAPAIFKMKAKSELGSGTLTFLTSGANKSTQRKIDLSVRPAVPYHVLLTSGWIPKKSVDLPHQRKMYTEFRELNVSVSHLPLALAQGLLQYLKKFPYGCTEQLVSQAFPLITLHSHPDFGFSPQVVSENLQKTFQILQSRQNGEGGFGLWAANSFVNDFVHVYAMHFLVEAKENNYPFPPELLEKGMAYMKNILSSEGKNLFEERLRAYAIYLLTRMGHVTTPYVETLRKRLDNNDAKVWLKDLTAVYLAGTYQLLQQTSEASRLIRNAKFGTEKAKDYAYYYDGLIRDGQILYMLAKHFPENMRSIGGNELMAIVDPVIKGNYNTLSSSYAIMGFSAFSKLNQIRMEKVKLWENLLNQAKRPLVLPQTLFPKIPFRNEAISLTVQNDSPHNLFYMMQEAGFDLSPPKDSIKNKVEIIHEFTDLDGNEVQETSVGSEIEVHLKIRSLDPNFISNLVVVDLLPGGFEVVMQKLASSESRSYLPQASSQEYSHQRRESEGYEGEGEYEGDESSYDGENTESSYDNNESYSSSWTSPIRSEKSTWNPEYGDIREDRIVLYGSIGPQVKEFVYRIKATNAGKYQVPPAFAESMYDRTIQARSLGGTFSISK